MKKTRFPIFKTKTKNKRQIFDLLSYEGRKKYFKAKTGKEIKKLQKYLQKNSFIAYLLGKKNAGKGTYSKLFMEVVDNKNVAHISIGDIVRKVHQDLSVKDKKRELIKFLEQNYRGYISIDESLKALSRRDTKGLLPSEFILALVKREIGEMEKKSFFIDGFPRELDQVSYSLFFRDLIDYRQDPDIFVLIDVPESVIDERMKYRVVCPHCQSLKNLKFHLPEEKYIKYDEQKKEFCFICDNLECQNQKMVSKEGDELGIEAIRERLERDEKLMEKSFSLYGIPKILLRNSVPVVEAQKYIDDYEITPEYNYELDTRALAKREDERSSSTTKAKKIKIIKKPWKIVDDDGVLAYSLLPEPVVVSLIVQLTEVLNL